jgi:hypothetical protein
MQFTVSPKNITVFRSNNLTSVVEYRRQGSVVGMTTGLRAGRSDVRVQVRTRNFNVHPGTGAQPASFLMDTGGYSQG